MKYPRLLLLLTMSLLTLSQLALGQTSDTFTLEGKLIQGTADGAELSQGLPLRLNVLSPEGTTQQSLSAANDSENAFSFQNVPLNPDAFYVVTATWAGIEQSSLPIKYEEISGVLEFPLYEITDSLDNVVANRGNLRIEFTDVNNVGIQILLELNYANLGDRIVLANTNTPDAAAFTIELPVGAFGIAPEQAPESVQRFVPVEQIDNLPIPGIRDTQPLVPNWPNVMRVSFFVPYQDGAVIDMRFPFALSDMGIFVREDTVQLDSPLLELTEEKQTTSGRVYEVYAQAQPLKAGEPFKFTLLGKPTETARPAVVESSGSSSGTLLIVMGLAVLIIFSALMIWLIRTRQTGRPST